MHRRQRHRDKWITALSSRFSSAVRRQLCRNHWPQPHIYYFHLEPAFSFFGYLATLTTVNRAGVTGGHRSTTAVNVPHDVRVSHALLASMRRIRIESC
ncbi:hypothetical protein BU26DRAFT_168027 [Trematosphaeria pertusa]|uniref:Uncharacterized protein n=1 Tax=Trematosphaeria pertusa TaxID=390896 RepID=A0A6A6HW84_9PLEO|nr:uncharacterized protein BU26DRAFT_168027 [Trematosphaeria pertusa]KAF2242179.1 hypothetical protein BU26DRAFT_168027 [Trematosphaeria pertusa]